MHHKKHKPTAILVTQEFTIDQTVIYSISSFPRDCQSFPGNQTGSVAFSLLHLVSYFSEGGFKQNTGELWTLWQFFTHCIGRFLKCNSIKIKQFECKYECVIPLLFQQHDITLANKPEVEGET